MEQQLSDTMKEILRLIVEGNYNKAIAIKTGLSFHTINTYINKRLPKYFDKEPEIRNGNYSPKSALASIGARYFNQKNDKGITMVYSKFLDMIRQALNEDDLELAAKLSIFFQDELEETYKTQDPNYSPEQMMRLDLLLAMKCFEEISTSATKMIKNAQQDIRLDFAEIIHNEDISQLDGFGATIVCMQIGHAFWESDEPLMTVYWFVRALYHLDRGDLDREVSLFTLSPIIKEWREYFQSELSDTIKSYINRSDLDVSFDGQSPSQFIIDLLQSYSKIYPYRDQLSNNPFTTTPVH